MATELALHFQITRKMAERRSAGKDRPTSSKNKGSRPSSVRSQKSVKDTVSKLTIKALKEFRLDDEEDTDGNGTGVVEANAGSVGSQAGQGTGRSAGGVRECIF